MNSIIGITLCVCAIISILYLIIENKKVIELSTYTYNYKLAYSMFEETRKIFMENNPDHYIKLLRIECHYGWNFYYKIERK